MVPAERTLSTLTLPGAASPPLVTTVLSLAAGLAVAGALAWLFDRRVAAGAGGPAPAGWAWPARRAAAFALLAGLFGAALFLPLVAMAAAGGVPPLDLESLARAPWRVFLLHILLLATLAAWGFAGWGGQAEPAPARRAAFAAFLRLPATAPATELKLGLAAGLAAWAGVLAVAAAVAAAAGALGGGGLLPEGPPELVRFLATRPVAFRLALALSAGVVEELFFRGFLQPRLGVGLTTALFVLAHAGYGQPLQLLSVGLLSLVYGGLARWRGNVWAAVVAHALFDGVQLLIVIPAALELLDGSPPARPW